MRLFRIYLKGCFRLFNTYRRNALERFPVRVSSISVTSVLMDLFSRAAMVLSSPQNSSSNVMDVAWPATLTERFFMV